MKLQGAAITAIEYALPDRILTNDQISESHPEWRMDEVGKRTGVDQRHIAGTETALDLGEHAARVALDRSGLDASDIDTVLFCTQTPDHIMPPNATLLQHRLGLGTRLPAFDFTLACSGYVYGLFLAKSLIGSGNARNVLFVAGDTYSRLISPNDRGPYTLFGDGAAATIISAGDDKIGAFELGSDGARADCFIVPAGGAREPHSAYSATEQLDESGNRRTREHIHMRGMDVLAFAQREVPGAVERLLAREQLTIRDLDLVVFHQASRLALDYLMRALGVSPDQTYSNLDRVGNTVSASLPIAMRDAETEGRLRTGDRVLLVGFGVGLSWGACLIRR